MWCLCKSWRPTMNFETFACELSDALLCFIQDVFSQIYISAFIVSDHKQTLINIQIRRIMYLDKPHYPPALYLTTQGYSDQDNLLSQWKEKLHNPTGCRHCGVFLWRGWLRQRRGTKGGRKKMNHAARQEKRSGVCEVVCHWWRNNTDETDTTQHRETFGCDAAKLSIVSRKATIALRKTAFFFFKERMTHALISNNFLTR